ncbi:MAG: TetR/AcrR family transcriptional regulator [Patulibacter sp.]|nr:TetR/AcrR family transcriptional regulator [Patulibacter sp.]
MRTPPTNGQPGGRRETTERRILESAIELIGTGITWPQLGIRQITERAQISRTAFYDFFGNKNEILEHLVRGVHDDLGRALVSATPWRADDERSPTLDLTRLRVLLETIAEFNVVHGAIYRAFLDAARQDPAIDDMWHDLMGAYVAVVARGIDGARAAHGAVPPPPGSEALARVLILMTERTMLLLSRFEPGDPAAGELVETLALVWERSVYGAGASTPGG